MPPGKDARLFVFRLSAVQRGIEGKQAVKGKYDCRENKLEKTKGDSVLHILVVSVQLIFFSDCPDFTEKKNEWEFDFICFHLETSQR